MPEPLNLPDNPEHCPTCNASFQGAFCYVCGEKKPSRKDYTLTKYVTQAVDMFTHFDGKFFTSIKYLFFFPGRLTEENLAGRKVKLMKPVQLFLVISLAYFFLMRDVDLFVYFLKWASDADPVYKQALKIAAKRGVSFREYVIHYDEVIVTTAKTFIFMLVPLFGLGIWLLFFRRIKQFVPHLIFATHFFSFFLAFSLVYFELILRWFDPAALSKGQKLLGVSIGIGILMIYLFLALRRIYTQNYILTFLKTSALILWLLATIAIYQTYLGWITLLIA